MAVGFGLGLLVAPLTLLLGSFLGLPPLMTAAVFLAVTAGAASTPPRDARRVAGVLLGIGTAVVAFYGFFAVLIMSGPMG
jgi:hypothetical protein